jgi:hypothetical protein
MTNTLFHTDGGVLSCHFTRSADTAVCGGIQLIPYAGAAILTSSVLHLFWGY